MPNTYYGCSGSEQSLQDCNKATHFYCNIDSYPNRMAGLACHSPLGGECVCVFAILCNIRNGLLISLDCTHGDLRLVGGESESEGRVEVCYKGGWYSLCGTEDEEASVICKQLGYTVYNCKMHRT